MNTKLINDIETNFIDAFQQKPLLVFSPGRVNLIGEHTDYNNGFVFPAAIDKGIVLAMARSRNSYCTVKAIDLNEEYQFELHSIKPLPSNGWQNYVLGVIAEILKKGKFLDNFNLIFGSDLSIGSGLSSSAAIENAVVFGLNELFRLEFTKHEMIYISQAAEHHYVGVLCGIMDQYASMFGAYNTALLLDCLTVTSKPYKIELNDYELVLINTNVKHSLAESAYNERRRTCENIAKKLNINSLREVSESDLEIIKDQLDKKEFDNALFVIQENTRVLQAAKALEIGDLLSFGNLMYQSHSGLQHQYNVSCDELDFLVDKTREIDNVIGSRMMGGGFGGCTINIIHNSAIDTVTSYIKEQYNKKFNRACTPLTVKISRGVHLI